MEGFTLTMFPPEAIQVLEHSQSRVVILDPPYYSFGTLMLCFGLATLAGGIFFTVRHLMAAFTVVLFVLTIALLLFGSYLATKKSTITLSREDGLLHIQRQFWGIKRPEASLRTADVRRVTVETLKYSRTLTVVMKSGESYALGDGSDRQGYQAAADAINDFLGVPAQ